MKKILMTLAAILCCILTLHAQPISEQQAMERALQYMNSNRSSASARRMAVPALGGSKALTPAATEPTPSVSPVTARPSSEKSQYNGSIL